MPGIPMVGYMHPVSCQSYPRTRSRHDMIYYMFMNVRILFTLKNADNVGSCKKSILAPKIHLGLPYLASSTERRPMMKAL
jgi:hypothetical protein